MAKNYTKTKIKTAINVAMNNIVFYGSSAQRGVTFQGFEVLEKMLRAKQRNMATERLKSMLKHEPRPYQFWIGVFYNNGADTDITVIEKPDMTVPEIDVWLTGYITDLIEEIGKEKCLGYGWVGTPCMSFDLNADDEARVEQFLNQGVLDQIKRHNIVEEYHLEKSTKSTFNPAAILKQQ